MNINLATPEDTSRVHQNAVVIANIVELVCSCVKKAAQQDMSSALGDESLNKSVLASIVASHIQDSLVKA